MGYDLGLEEDALLLEICRLVLGCCVGCSVRRPFDRSESKQEINTSSIHAVAEDPRLHSNVGSCARMSCAQEKASQRR